ncbi:MAG TPA: efflux RND transporter permease subunit [Clostridia bacterium]|nr:efflux RND transporter permease subunit [Clostridia bacterium]
MISKILKSSFSRPVLTLVLVLAACALGAVWLQDLRRDVFPDLSAPVFNVIVQNPAMGAEELETGVAVPMEVALAGLPDVRRIRSTSLLGVTQVTVEFESDADYNRSRQFVAERVNQVAAQLPPGMDAPNISSLTGRLNEIFEFTLEAQPGAADPMVLRDLAEFEVRNRLLAVPGVASIERLGGYLRQFQVQLDPDRMSARGITLDDVEHAVQGSNINAAGGFVTEGSMEWTVRAVGRASNVEDLRSTIVAMKSRTPVLLGDIADVREAPAVRRGVAHRLNGEVVSCRVIKQFGADTMMVSAGIREALDDIGKTLPKGVQLRTVYDQSVLIGSSLGGVERAILIGAVLVILVLFALLGDLRAALVVTLTLPLSIALSGLLLKPLGIGINTMTLGGLAIAVGLLVDAAIIVTENIVHRITVRHTNGNRRETALAAAIEVGRPIAFATFIVMAVFLPLFAMTGIEGRMYSPLAAAVVAAIAASLVLALTLVPVVAAMFLRPKHSVAEEDVWLVRKLKAVYAPFLDYALRHRGKVLIVAFAVTAPTLVLALYVGSDFMPKLNEGAFLIQTVLPPETSLDEVDRVNHRVEDALRTFPEVEDVVRRTGRAERSEDPMPHTWSDVLVILKPDGGRAPDQLEDAMREKLQGIAGVTTLFTTPLGMRIDEGLGGTPADISVRIFGADLDKLAALGERAQELMRGIKGVEDLRVEKLTGMPQLKVSIDRQAVARVGLTPGDVIRAIRVGLAGEEESEVWIGQRRFDMVVKLQDEHRNTPKSIGALLVDGHDGSRIPLSQLATIEQTFGPGTIRREAGSRRIAVESAVDGRDLGSTAAEINAKLSRELSLPTGYFFNVGGRVESQSRAADSLRIAIAVAILAVFLLLYMALGSAAEAAVILATLPTASVGGIVALLIAGETWNVSSLVGLIGLFGIAVQNGLVLISQTRGLVAEGMPFEDALRGACIGRVRPKIMTAATAILGLLPLLVLRLHGTEIERPLAVVMIGGLVTSTLFTLLALPTFYMTVHRLQERYASRLRHSSQTAQMEGD